MSGTNNHRYGANTTCFEIRSPGLESRIVIDAGTGINRLGAELRRKSGRDPGKKREPIHILFSHSHWDHIQGFPFFPPLYEPGQTIVIHYHSSQDYREILSKQMSPPFYPGTMNTARAKLIYEPFDGEDVVIEGIRLRPYGLRHTADQRSYAYCVALLAGGPRAVLASDRQQVRDGSRDKEEDRFYQEAKGLDLLVHDSFFTDSDFETHATWGHPSVSYVVSEAQRLEAKKLCLHHFNPEYDDREVDALIDRARRMNGDNPMEIVAAVEGQSIVL